MPSRPSGVQSEVILASGEPIGETKESDAFDAVGERFTELSRLVYEHVRSATQPAALRRKLGELLDMAAVKEHLTFASELLHKSFDSELVVSGIARAGLPIPPLPFEEELEAAFAFRARDILQWGIIIVGGVLQREFQGTSGRISKELLSADVSVDPKIPRQVRRAIHRRDVAIFAFVAILGATLPGTSPPPGMIGMLYEVFVEEPRAWFGLAAHFFPHFAVPEHLQEPADWEAVKAEHTRILEAKEESLRRFLEGNREPRLVMQDEGDA